VKQEDGAAECTLELAESDFLDLTQGKADPMKLFTTGKLKISGNVMASQKLQSLFKIDPSKAIETVMARRGGGGGAAAAAPAAAGATQAAVPNSADIFRAIGGFVQGNPATAEKVKTTFLFKLSNPDSTWTIDLSTPPGAVHDSAVGKAACTLEISDADFMAMATGQADAMKLFSSGKLKISGDVMASQKLGFLKKITPEMVLAETKKRSGTAELASKDVTPAAAYTPTVDDAFEVFGEVIKTNPEVCQKVGVVYLFRVGGKPFIVDLKNGAVKQEVGAAECTLELAESDFMDLTQGKADPMKLFTTGKLKISGNVMASQKLQSLFKIDPKNAIETVM
jgi:3-hydroxyacyl-CoA dehydrogenase/3a,7a,12a-trihydroxy-5b-cholest-24-enoyl-CoA hydratase